MNRRENYVDIDRYKRTCAAQKQRQRNRDAMPFKRWTMQDDIAVLAHRIPDSELMFKINHSRNAIRIRRQRLRKATEALHISEINEDNYESLLRFVSTLR